MKSALTIVHCCLISLCCAMSVCAMEEENNSKQKVKFHIPKIVIRKKNNPVKELFSQKLIEENHVEKKEEASDHHCNFANIEFPAEEKTPPFVFENTLLHSITSACIVLGAAAVFLFIKNWYELYHKDEGTYPPNK